MKKIFTLLAAALFSAGIASAEIKTDTFDGNGTNVVNGTVEGNGITTVFLDKSEKGNIEGTGAKSWDFSKRDYVAGLDNGMVIKFMPKFSGELKIIFQNKVADNKSLNMIVNGDKSNTINATLEDGTVVTNGVNFEAHDPALTGIATNGYILYQLEANNTYYFYVGGTKYRIGGYEYTYDEVIASTDPQISFPKSNYTTVYGEAFEAPVATAAAEGANGTFTYSTESDIVTVDAETGAVTLLGVGAAEIVATYVPAEGETFTTNLTTKYTLTVNAPVTLAYIMSYGVEGIENSGYSLPVGTETRLATSEEGVLVFGETETPALILRNNWDSSKNDNYVLLSVEGGFKKGDILTVKACANTKTTDPAKPKTAGIKVHGENKSSSTIGKSANFVNLAEEQADVIEVYTLTLKADCQNLYISRNGSTGTFMTMVSVQRPTEMEILTAPSHNWGTETAIPLATNTKIEFMHEDPEVEIYYAWEMPVAAEPVMAKAPAAESFVKYSAENQPLFAAENTGDTWTLHYYAAKPGFANSPVKTLAITHNGNDTTGIDAIVAEEGEVEYFNLQGIRVAEPANGVFIRRQGNKVTKVLVK